MARPEDLQEDLIRHICGRLLCRVDRASMAAVCRSWEAALTGDAVLRQLPVLFFPRAHEPDCSCLSCDGALHHVFLPEEVDYARCIGSYHNWWLLLALDYLREPALSNRNTGHQIQVPDAMRKGIPDRIIDVVIQFATFSAMPSPQLPAAQCYGAAIVGQFHLRDIMFWRCDQQFGLSSRNVAFDWARHAVDVIFHNGVFKFLTATERLVMIDPEIGENDLELNADVWAPTVFGIGDGPVVEHNNMVLQVIARYLVVSGDDLLLIRRYGLQDWGTNTHVFRIYHLVQEHVGQSPEEDQFRWVELPELEGRIIFVARGCSRCYHVGRFSGLSSCSGRCVFQG